MGKEVLNCFSYHQFYASISKGGFIGVGGRTPPHFMSQNIFMTVLIAKKKVTH